MAKLDTSSTSLTYPIDPHTDLEPARRLIVLVPADSDDNAATHRIWELANASGACVQFLGLCKDPVQEPGLRRRLATIASLLQDGKISAEAKVEIGMNWVDIVKRNYQTGDVIVCLAEQRAGLLHRPLSQILQSSLNAPIYILSSQQPQNLPRSNWFSQIMAWAGSIAIIIVSTFLQIRLTSLPQDWVQTTLLILSVIGEAWLIWGWNSLFSSSSRTLEFSMLSVILLIVIFILAYKVAPREKKEDEHIHGAGQIGLIGALALFGVDYFTSYYYATGEMMSALHPYGLQDKAYIAAGVIAFANFAFGLLYMFSLGPFNEGGGSYTASMRYLWPTLSLIVAVALIQDYVLTIVVSALSGGDQLLSIIGLYGKNWLYHFALGAILAGVTWYLTIRGRGESAKVVFMLIVIFVFLTITMGIGLLMAHLKGVPAIPMEAAPKAVSLGTALMHLLTASMKGMVALTGLEAVSNGIQFFKDEDTTFVKWGKKHMPRLRGLWKFYSGKSGIGRFVQTSFLFYGGLTTLFLTFFAIRFDVFDGTLGRTLVGNLAFIGFNEIPGGVILFWTYQILAVLMLAAASMTALQDAQATEWRDVAIGEIPEIIIYRDKRGTFTRSVTITFGISILIMLLVRGQTTVAVPFYGVGVFMPITAMGLAVRKHILEHFTGRARSWGSLGASLWQFWAVPFLHLTYRKVA
jgi:amino acid transporter